MNIGLAIKSVRVRSSFSQEELANATGVSTSYISLVERNKRDPSLGFLKRIADALEVPLPILFLLAEQNEAGESRSAGRSVVIEELLRLAFYSR
ncbi:MAG: helix-turn-helix transcriptional regulator [Calditrichaeota bacterium]|nr:helix-turn-helix transcriptional regulator [Calditrichota bacterium]MCB9474571.1 helix-turn-helix transcriptional regulator [Candidatus Delongbacteria bacterium]